MVRLSSPISCHPWTLTFSPLPAGRRIYSVASKLMGMETLKEITNRVVSLQYKSCPSFGVQFLEKLFAKDRMLGTYRLITSKGM